MKILLVSTSSGSRGGGELSLIYLGQALHDRGHEVHLWTSNHPRMDELAAKFALIGPVHRADYTNTYDRRARSLGAWLDRSTPKRIAGEWRALAPDIIHLNKQNLEDGLDLVAAASFSGLPAVAMIHITQSARYLKAEFAPLRDAIAKCELLKFPGTFVTTPGSRENDLAGFLSGRSRIRTVPNGVPVPAEVLLAELRSFKRVELHIPDDCLLIAAVGRMVPQKRPLLFLNLAEKLHTADPNTRFIWIGDGSETGAWDDLVASRGMESYVQRLPWQHEVTPLLAAADVFMHVAEFEGLAFAILEALAAGKPCAITPNLLHEMPFLDRSNSIEIDDNGRWIETLRDKSQLAQIGSAARRLAEERFSFNSTAAEYERIYQEEIALRDR